MLKINKKKNEGDPNISTAALPDIVFMLLFFFMVTTIMREVALKVKITTPKATEVNKLERRSLVSYIYIGEPVESIYGSAERIQLNDAFATKDEILEFVATEREPMDPAEVPLMTFSMKVDSKAEMGIVTDVKQELRKANALKINYSTKKTDQIVD